MRAFRPAQLVVPALWGALAAMLLGAAAWRSAGALAGALVGLAVWAGPLGLALRRPLRRLRLARQGTPEADRAWLAEHVRLYAALDAAGRARFERDVRWLLAETRVEAVPGVALTDAHRLAVAAGGALLLHGRPDWELPGARSVVFTPAAFDEAYGDEEDGVYDGMVHAQGPVVLSAQAALDGWARADGQNVVLHELAHLFDMDGTGADGVPALMDARSGEAWRALAREEMRRARTGRSVLRSYAATDRAELFAVATEQFFERPARLRARHPELFEALRAFFNVTPPDEAVPEDAESLMARRWE